MEDSFIPSRIISENIAFYFQDLTNNADYQLISANYQPIIRYAGKSGLSNRRVEFAKLILRMFR